MQVGIGAIELKKDERLFLATSQDNEHKYQVRVHLGQRFSKFAQGDQGSGP